MNFAPAAEALFVHGRKGPVEAPAPYWLLAIHAIELYLNAVLIKQKCSAAEVRGLRHDLATRAVWAASSKLPLRNRTRAHLDRLTQTREYLVARYDPSQAGVCELTRLSATLAEVAEKAGRIFGRARPSPR